MNNNLLTKAADVILVAGIVFALSVAAYMAMLWNAFAIAGCLAVSALLMCLLRAGHRNRNGKSTRKTDDN